MTRKDDKGDQPSGGVIRRRHAEAFAQSRTQRLSNDDDDHHHHHQMYDQHDRRLASGHVPEVVVISSS